MVSGQPHEEVLLPEGVPVLFLTLSDSLEFAPCTAWAWGCAGVFCGVIIGVLLSPLQRRTLNLCEETGLTWPGEKDSHEILTLLHMLESSKDMKTHPSSSC